MAARNKSKQTHAQKIDDRFDDYSELGEDLQKAGLESSNLIIGIDFTESNTAQGTRTFGGKSLHTIDENCLNPYQRVIKSIFKTLAKFQEDPYIPVFGFGDAKTRDKRVFRILYEGQECTTLEHIFHAYTTITPTITLSGPTNFAPLIHKAIDIVKTNKQYYILLIITDGAVIAKQETSDAIVEASNYPLSIIAVGVGDGPWGTMNQYDDELPERQFDNFQFVDYNQVNSHDNSAISTDKVDIEFARNAVMEIPDQFRAIKELGFLNWDND